MDLALDLLAMDLTNDPDPVRYDGTPPKLEKESVLLASLFDITGYLVRKVFADTGNDDAVFYYINDHLGTPRIIADETGNIVWKGDYQPFGSVNAVVSDLGNNFRFAGQYYDEETGLHYNWHRYYDPATGRYLTPDSIGLAGGTNLYQYALANPINLLDPLGLEMYRPGYDPKSLGQQWVEFVNIVSEKLTPKRSSAEIQEAQQIYYKDIAERLNDAAEVALLYGKAEKALVIQPRYLFWTYVITRKVPPIWPPLTPIESDNPCE